MSVFTQRHYTRIASCMAQCKPPQTGTQDCVQHFQDCVRLAEMFERDNERFRFGVFMRACGYPNTTMPEGMSQNGTNLTQPITRTQP